MRKIRITAGATMATAILNDSPTADAIWDTLPIQARVNTWGDEIYFSIPIQMDESDDAREVVEIGDLGYWPPGHAFCIFFGRTPASRGNEARAASPVNHLGHVEGDPTIFTAVPDGAVIVLERVTSEN